MPKGNRERTIRSSAREPIARYASHVPTTRRRRIVLKEGITFREFKLVLESYGFEPVTTTGKHKVFAEENSGAMVVVPGYEDKEKVNTLHIVALSRLLVEKGLVPSP